ncbi:hypothetical protein [Croceicoccus mobilis]|uniref:Uncharacterized protein n=1 Tax=Croceicoccus mobilis TaxID=1703339 RepID=A0A916YVU8_9SPHN|nr:hypothetical protein [Croceicoccus mobilis]GGD64461.1 hypothetical protein GCM10010990_12380 [Croceicoccus mobilis]
MNANLGSSSEREEIANRLSYDWESLKNKKSKQGTSLQDFWRRSGNGGGLASDDQLLAMGHLIDVPDIGRYHIAYIPWKSSHPALSKQNWKDKEWALLNRVLKICCERNPVFVQNFEWTNLTVRSEYAIPFIKANFNNCHFIGDIDGGEFHPNKVFSCRFDGYIKNAKSEFTGCFCNGTVIFDSRDAKVNHCEFNELVAHNRNTLPRSLEVTDSKINRIVIRGAMKSVICRRTENNNLDASDAHIGKINLSEMGGDGIFNFHRSVIENYATFEIVLINSSSDYRNVFKNCRFDDKVVFLNTSLKLSEFCEVRLNQPIDIRLYAKTPEAACDEEIKEIRALSKWDRDARLDALERSCQIISDRHRQDGRRDLEHRFRRMEIKSRSYKSSNVGFAKFVSRFYGLVSNFGVSLYRPIVSLLVLLLCSAATYAAIGAFAQGLTEIGGTLRPEVLLDAAKLSFQHIFPIGISVDGSNLFDGKLIGEDSGAYGLVVGVLATCQTILSGILIFLFGLAVRAKLLIG